MPLYGEEKRAYQRGWIKKRRDDWIESQGGLCVICGSTEELEVDHIDRETKLCNPRLVWSRNQAFREAELAKCQVLCSDCHQKKTTKENTRPVEHGSYRRGYSTGCKCDACMESMRIFWRNRRSNK